MHYKKAKFDWLSPGCIFGVLILMGGLLPVLPFLAEMDGFTKSWSYDFKDKNSAIFFGATIYIFVALIVLFIGNQVKAKKIISKKIKIICKKRLIIYGSLFTAAAIIAVMQILSVVGGVEGVLEAASDRTRKYAGLSHYLIAINFLVSICYLWYFRIESNIDIRIFEKLSFCSYLSISIFVIMILGHKSTIFILLTMMLVTRNRLKSRIKLKNILLFMSILFIVLMIYQIIKSELWAVGEIVTIGADGNSVLETFLFYLVENFTGNLMQLQNMAVIMEAVPEKLDYQYGLGWLMTLLIFIPSTILENKPLTTPGIYTMAIWPDKWIYEGTTMPPGIFGEAYINFGVVGIIIISVLFSRYWFGTYKNHLAMEADQLKLAKYSLAAATMLHFFRGEIAAVFVAAITIYFPLIFVFKNIRRN